MEPNRINVKLFLRDADGVALARFVPVFQRWIRDDVLSDTLVDVHDYSHVHEGAGILLVAFEANYSMDEARGELGLLYGRKQPVDGSAEDRFGAALATALDAAVKLEAEEGLGVRFATDRVQLIVNDRLSAPNTEATLAELRPALDAVLGRLWDGAAYEMECEPEPRRRFGVDARSRGASDDLATLAARLS